MKELKSQDRNNLFSNISQNSQEKKIVRDPHIFTDIHDPLLKRLLARKMLQTCHSFPGAIAFCSFLFTLRSSHRRCSIKNLFLKTSQYSQENNCVGVLF